MQKQVFVKGKRVREKLFTECTHHWISWCMIHQVIQEEFFHKKTSTTEAGKEQPSTLKFQEELFARNPT